MNKVNNFKLNTSERNHNSLRLKTYLWKVLDYTLNFVNRFKMIIQISMLSNV